MGCFELHYQGILLYYPRNKQLFFWCVMCVWIYYQIFPIALILYLLLFSSLQQPIPKVANVSPLSIIVGGTTLPMHFGRSWKTVHTTYEKTRR